jgi:RNA polymerase sigma factor (sigma-70 family)
MPGTIDVTAAYKTHGNVVLRRARQILGTDDAEEVLQEVFIALAEDPDQFRGQSSLVSYLYSATTHACLNRIRNKKTRAALLTEKVAPSEEPRTDAGGETLAIVRDLLERVPDDLARVAVYYYVDEMTHDEIAEIMGCSKRQVGNLVERFHRAVEELP